MNSEAIAKIVDGISSELSETRYRMILAITNNDSEKEILVFALAKLVDYFKLTYYDTDEESEFVDWSKISRDK